ncbi:hypothetical protein MLD38_006244 [Melastoma candidum]|uniref:Uncharacterized protein n=1 Tax=Melastoma candidum TaxID=119954 RepID=A0ACB9RLX0_9MYRT|nr:hypothetical protein MLD38_006244 [Melastoma candidum]
MEAEAKADSYPDAKRLKSSSRPKPPPRRSVSSHQSLPLAPPELLKRRIDEAKRFAVAQARQDGCTGNYRIFDSQFGNFLLPVIPNRAELGGYQHHSHG